MNVAIIVSVALLLGVFVQQPASAPPSPTLDFEFFKTRVQPIFLAKRPGHARCVACHGQGTPLRLQPLSVRRVATDGMKSRLLVHPLDEKAGGDFYHSGGKHWASQTDPEWQTLRAWVLGQTR